MARAKPRVPIWLFVLPPLLLVLAAAGWWTLKPSPPPVPVMAVVPPPSLPTIPAPEPLVARGVTVPPPEVRDFRIEAATEQHILDHVPSETAPDLTVFRFIANPRVLVLDFTSLRDQGLMLNRAAAFVEKTGLPHDRLLNDTELDAAVRAGGDTVETFYYGHDYGTASLVRFFALADRDSMHLLAGEETLRRLIRQEGWFEPGARAAMISIPQVGADEHVTRLARATILHHELSHGEYFTNPAYTAFVHRFWTQTLTATERDHIRHHLHSLGYDSALDDVMENEAQAYLMFTDSADFFTPEMVGMTRGRLGELRAGFLRTMPAGWLHDSLGDTLSANKTAASARP